MPNPLHFDPKDIEGRRFQPITMAGGVDQETSKFSVPAGTLGNSLNYNSSTRGYQRAQGLWQYDGTIDAAVTDMWIVGVDDNDATLTGTGFTLGGGATWGDDSSGTVVYYKRVLGTPDYTLLGITEVTGAAPAAGDTIVDVVSDPNTTLALGESLTYEPATLATAKYPDTGNLICGTVTDYLAFINDEVNAGLVGQTERISQGAGDINTYQGSVPGTGRINGGWQFDEDVYVVRDGYGCTFNYGSSEFLPGDEVKVDIDPAEGTTQTCTVVKVELTSGLWSQGTAAGKVVFAPNTSTGDYRKMLNLETGTGSIKDTSDNELADILDHQQSVGSLVWKGTVQGWDFVDTGWTIPFDTGTNAPNVKAAPLFQADLIDGSRETTLAYPAAGTNAGDTPYTAWTSPGNVTSGGNVTASLGPGSTSQYLKCQIVADALPHDDIRIIGVEIQIESAGSGTDEPLLTHLSLVNEATGANFYQSFNKADNTASPTVAATSTYGGNGDTWGVEEISAADINSGDCHFFIQYYNAGAGTGVVTLSDVKYKIYYRTNNEKVWFNDGSSDVAVGEIHAYQISSGDFGSANSAEGTMSFTNLTNPSSIGTGMSMYTQPSKGGLLVAHVAETPSYNLLPSEDAMVAEDSQYNTIVANYYENDESEAVYGVTGAGPAFTFDGTNFAFIKAPLAQKLDKPRHLAFHENRLALGYKTGHVILSGVGTPNNFSAVDSASSWGVGDRVTGLMSLAGNVLGVFSESSINSLQGSSESTGTMRTISATTGAREYTLENIAGPYYADNRGIAALDTSDKYGDFDMGRLSDKVRTWAQDRLQERRTTQTLDTSPAAAVAMRNKNQYRIFFNDGYILVFHFFQNRPPEASFMHYDTDSFGTTYVPTWINSHIMPNGRERVLMGTEAGTVWVVDGANIVQGTGSQVKPKCFLTMNPINMGRPDILHKHFHVVIQGQFYGAQSFDSWSGNNYLFNFNTTADDSVTLGSYSNTPLFSAQSSLDSTYLPTLTDGFTMKLETTMDGSQPHTIQSLMFRASPKGMDRNSAPNTY